MFRIADHIASAELVREGSHLYKAVRSDGRLSAVQVFPFAMNSEQYGVFTQQVDLLDKTVSHHHINVPTILSWGFTQSENFCFVEREWIEGSDLRRLFNNEKKITIEEIGNVAEQTARALTLCHSVDVLHGSISPEHILWDERKGQYSLTGFRFGLPPSETISKKSLEVDPKASLVSPKEKDVYDLGLVLFQLLKDHLPETTQVNEVDALPNQKLKDGSTVPPWLPTCISSALATGEERFTSAHEMYSYIILHHKTPIPANKWYRSKPQQPVPRAKPRVKAAKPSQQKLQRAWTSGVERGKQEMRFVFDRRIAAGLVIAGVLAGFSIIAQKRENEKVRRQSMGMSSSPQQYATAVTNEAIEDSSETTIIQKNRTAAAAEKKTVQLKKTEKKKTVEKTPSANSVSEKAESNGDVGAYKVRSKAYFHNEPDESSRRNAFIVHWNNAVLHPIKEENDFVYVVFTNDEGQTSKGWLRKKDLVKL